MPEAKRLPLREEYTKYQKREMWFDIHIQRTCPECGETGTMTIKARGGDALNMLCLKCGTVFQSSPFFTTGAYPIGKGAE